MEQENNFLGIKEDIEKARMIHERSMPGKLPLINSYQFAAYYQPACKLGGDYYSVVRLNDKIVIYLSDVSGHGFDSAILSLFVKNTIGCYLSLFNNNPEKITVPLILGHLNTLYHQENFPEDYFVCIFMGILDLPTNEFSYSSAGFHVPPLKAGQGDTLIALNCDGLPISGSYSQDFVAFDEHKTIIYPGNALLFATDGIYEQNIDITADTIKGVNSADDRTTYGIYLKELFLKNYYYRAEEIVSTIKNDFINSMGNNKNNDDVTLLVMKKTGAQ